MEQLRTEIAGDGMDAVALLDDLPRRYGALREAVRGVIVGQQEAVDLLIVSAICQGHALLIGVPGLAKTMLVRAVAGALDLEFRRIQFTPDMMPSDVLGSELIQTDPATGERTMRFVEGPIFGQVILADEINRTPPKTQAALLEAMAEGQVTAGGRTRRLDQPFVVFATQNPIEQEGTYPLPEAQLDRFMFSLRLEYPKAAEERRIVVESGRIERASRSVAPMLDGPTILALRDAIGAIPVSDHVVDYAVALVRGTRPTDEGCPKGLRGAIQWGAGPRAGRDLIAAARCLAALEGEPTPTIGHIERLAGPILRHRVVLSYEAIARGHDVEGVVQGLLKAVRPGEYA